MLMICPAVCTVTMLVALADAACSPAISNSAGLDRSVADEYSNLSVQYRPHMINSDPQPAPTTSIDLHVGGPRSPTPVSDLYR